MEERKQFGTIFVKGELPLEIQLQAEREAVDRKEKEVRCLCNVSTDSLDYLFLLTFEYSKLCR